jgi:hypothetical protein
LILSLLSLSTYDSADCYLNYFGFVQLEATVESNAAAGEPADVEQSDLSTPGKW